MRSRGRDHPGRRAAPAMALLSCVVAVQAPAQDPGSASPAPPAEPRQADTYGRTPDTVIPFRDFSEPYLRFFQTVQEFLGTGREVTPAEAPQRVRIGFFAPLGEAPDADLGQAMLDGVTLALEQANALGGCGGIPYELVVRPDSGLWGATSNEMAAFKYEDDVLAVLGSIDGANTHIALRVALKTQMPMVNTGTTDPTLTETRIPWLLRCMADDRQQGYALAYHMFVEEDLGEVVAFRVNDRYGRMGIAEFRDAARRLRRPLRAELRWDRGERDFQRQLDRIEQLDPEAVVLWGNAEDLAAVVLAIRERGLSPRLFASDRAISAGFLKQAGPAAEGLVAAATFDPTRADPAFRAFKDAYAARFGKHAETFAAHAYDGMNILLAAIETADFNRVLVRDALHELKRYDGVTGPIPFDTTMNDIGPVHLAIVIDGVFRYRPVVYETAARSSVADEATPYRALAQSPPKGMSPEPAIGSAPPVVRLGVFLPLDEHGKAVVRGMRQALAARRIVDPEAPDIELVVRDAVGPWGEASGALVDLVFEAKVLAVIGSTERQGTHLAEMLAAKAHLPVLAMCGDDPSITQIPLPWVFNLVPEAAEIEYEALGRDAASLLAEAIGAGAWNRAALRAALAGSGRFDALGNPIDVEGTRTSWNENGSTGGRSIPESAVGGAGTSSPATGTEDSSERGSDP